MNMAGDPLPGTAVGKAVDLLDRGDHALGAGASLVACRCASLKYTGTVMTTSVTFSPRKFRGVPGELAQDRRRNLFRRVFLPRISNLAAPSGPATRATCSFPARAVFALPVGYRE
jgi:hypothetical protein